MKEDTVKGIQVTANIAIIITALVLCAVLIKTYIIAKPAPSDATLVRGNSPSVGANVTSGRQAGAQIQAGTKLSLTGIDWAKNGQTLLLAVSATCHYCSESAPFYQHLGRDHGKTQLVALFPQPISEGKKYLDSLNVTVDDIKQARLSSFGVKGTPTLILVDGSGVVKNSWLGKLDADEETEVVNSLKQGGR